MTARPRRRRRVGWKGAALFGAVALAVAFWLMRSGMTPLTHERLAAAEARWQVARVSDYDMRVVINAAQKDRYDVVVRSGTLQSIRRGGVAADPTDSAYWTVEGLFHTLRRELQMVDSGTLAVSGGSAVLLARFDEARGYPAAFLRQVTGSPQGVAVEVVMFRVR